MRELFKPLRKNQIAVVSCAFMLATLSGCASSVSKKDTATFESALNAGDYRSAAAFATQAGKIAPDGSTKNIVWSLQAGSTLFDAGDMKTAITDLDTTEKLIQSNDLDKLHAQFDYNYTTYDGVMINVYKAMAFLAQHDKENARVELNRAEDRQRRAEEHFQKEVAAATAHNKEANDPQFPGFLKAAQQNSDYQSAGTKLSQLSIYAPFENPFETYLAGIFFISQNDQKGIDYLKRASAVLGQSSPAATDLAWAQQPGNSGIRQVWVVFENGQSSTYSEMRLVLPMATGQPMTLALPVLVQNAVAYPNLTVTTGTASSHTSLAGSFDAVMASEFNRRRPIILAEALAEVLLKNVAAVAAKQSNNNFLQLAAGIAANVSSADTRSWTALPKEFQVARVPVPADGHIGLSASDGTLLGSAVVALDRSSIVWVKVQRTGAHPSIQVLPL